MLPLEITYTSSDGPLSWAVIVHLSLSLSLSLSPSLPLPLPLSLSLSLRQHIQTARVHLPMAYLNDSIFSEIQPMLPKRCRLQLHVDILFCLKPTSVLTSFLRPLTDKKIIFIYKIKVTWIIIMENI